MYWTGLANHSFCNMSPESISVLCCASIKWKDGVRGQMANLIRRIIWCHHSIQLTSDIMMGDCHVMHQRLYSVWKHEREDFAIITLSQCSPPFMMSSDSKSFQETWRGRGTFSDKLMLSWTWLKHCSRTEGWSLLSNMCLPRGDHVERPWHDKITW